MRDDESKGMPIIIVGWPKNAAARKTLPWRLSIESLYQEEKNMALAGMEQCLLSEYCCNTSVCTEFGKSPIVPSGSISTNATNADLN